MRIGIGIDTGGTYTDAVAYDYESQTLLAKGKSLTTRDNLTVGIANALDMLPPEFIRNAALISLSTTLATNACVENKGCRAKLVIFGLTDEIIVRYNAETKYGFKKESVRCFDTHGSSDGLIIDEPDWDEVMSELSEWVSDADAMSVAELYSMSNGAICEKRAKELLEERFNIACVGASELTSELNVLERGATALLNTRLFPIGREFIEAATTDFAARGCTAPVMVVRSDGSLMSAELTRIRPVETILSGPAASVLAGKSFTDEKDYLIIDMGGTTTDVSVVKGGNPAMADSGIKIGGWRTHVKGVFIDTFALGGDSTVRIADDEPRLFPHRSIPICVAARRWPEVKTMLSEIMYKKHTNQFPLHEFLSLVREPNDPSRYDAYEQTLIAALRNGPCILGKLKDAAQIDLYHLNSERLEAEGVIIRCGLTPTDFMHIRGDYSEYDTEASELAARFLLLSLKRDDTSAELRTLADEVCCMVEGHLYENLLRILLSQQYPRRFADGPDLQTSTLVREAWANRDAEAADFLHHRFSTNLALIGVGAPTHVFLPAVAKALGTEYILPEHAEVANALGALKADIRAVSRVEVSQRLSLSRGLFYIVHSPEKSSAFVNLDKAIVAARSAAEAAAVKEARARGALGQLAINTYVTRLTTVSKDGAGVSMGCTAVSEVTARFG